MKQRLGQLVKDAQLYKTKACGMNGMLGLTAPSQADNVMRRMEKRRMVRKPPIPQLNKSKTRQMTQSSSGTALKPT